MLTEAVRLHGEDELRAREIDPEPGIDDARRIARELRATPEGRARTMRIGLVRGMWAGAFALLVAAAIIRTRPVPVPSLRQASSSIAPMPFVPYTDTSKIAVVADLPEDYEVRYLDNATAYRIVGTGKPFRDRREALRRVEDAVRALALAGHRNTGWASLDHGVPPDVASPVECILVAGTPASLRAVRWRREWSGVSTPAWRRVAEELVK